MGPNFRNLKRDLPVFRHAQNTLSGNTISMIETFALDTIDIGSIKRYNQSCIYISVSPA